jgi:amidase
MRGRRGDLARVNAIFDSFDVLVTPVMGGTALPVRRWEGRGALRTVLGMSRFYPYCVPWNHLGNPAMAVPAGFDADGMPLSVQVIGRPGDEATLLSLAAQLEAERPWADRRPPIS